MAAAGSQGGSRVAGLPIFALLVGLAFLIQWLVFLPAYWRKTEKSFDLTGSITYITVSTLALFLSEGVDGRAVLVWALVVIWIGIAVIPLPVLQGWQCTSMVMNSPPGGMASRPAT